eukprot:XP_001696832.1 predicted protein [Chlamydomonas reinhardtii]
MASCFSPFPRRCNDQRQLHVCHAAAAVVQHRQHQHRRPAALQPGDDGVVHTQQPQRGAVAARRAGGVSRNGAGVVHSGTQSKPTE